MRPTAGPRRANQRDDGQDVHRWNANEADRGRLRQVRANRGPHHPDVADDGEQWIREETAEDAEQHHVDDGIETAERRECDEQRRHGPVDKGSSSRRDQGETRGGPGQSGEDDVGVPDCRERESVASESACSREADVAGLDDDERHGQRQRGPEEVSGCGDTGASQGGVCRASRADLLMIAGPKAVSGQFSQVKASAAGVRRARTRGRCDACWRHSPADLRRARGSRRSCRW